MVAYPNELVYVHERSLSRLTYFLLACNLNIFTVVITQVVIIVESRTKPIAPPSTATFVVSEAYVFPKSK